MHQKCTVECRTMKKNILISNQTHLRNKVRVYSFKCVYHADQQWILVKDKIYVLTLKTSFDGCLK